jgi:hypothetical protein
MVSVVFYERHDMTIGNAIYWLALAYACCGGVAAVAFLAFGLDRIDPSAHRSYAFRPLLVPGLILLWPLVLVIWRHRVSSSAGA